MSDEPGQTVTGQIIGGVLGGPVGSAIGAGIGGLVGGHGARKQYKMQRKVMNRQYKLNRSMRQTEVQDRMGDLAAAGINPILAGKFAGSSLGVSALDPPDIGGAMLQGASTALQTGKAAGEMEKIAVETEQFFNEWLRSSMDLDRQELLSRYFEDLTDLEYEEARIRVATLGEEFKEARRRGEIAESEYGEFMARVKAFTEATGVTAPRFTGRIGGRR